MNLSQIMRKARFEVDAIRASGSTSALWADEEVIDAANTAMDRAAKLVRLADSNILTKTMKSTDAAADMITETYNPTSLALVANTVDYTLPPDFVRVETIIPLTAGYEDVKFLPASLQQRTWMNQAKLTVDDLDPVKNSAQIFYYNIVGSRTLRIRPLPLEAFDIELNYQYRPPKLINYSTGTISITNGLTALVGSGSLWLTSGLRTPLDLVSGSATVVSLAVNYPRVSAVLTATTATMTSVWAPATVVAGTYHLSMIPQLPEEHHAWLAQMTAAIMLRKVSPDLSKSAMEDLEKQMSLEVQPEVVIRQVQESLPVDEYTTG